MSYQPEKPSNEQVWIIEPHDPLIARDGRPFNPTPGVRARTLPFPPPSVTAGGARTRAGSDASGAFTASVQDVKQITVRGPLLIQLDSTDPTPYFAPAPADAVVFRTATADDARGNESDGGGNGAGSGFCTATADDLRGNIHQLVPLKATGHTDLAQTDSAPALLGLTRIIKEKPHPAPPRFWRWKHFEQWLLDPKDAENTDLVDQGIGNLPVDQRTHVKITPETQTAEEGMLFQTHGLSFTYVSPVTAAGQELQQAKRLALAIAVDTSAAADVAEIDEAFAALGGERRIVRWRNGAASLAKPPAVLFERIAATGYCRLIMLTPAFFTEGYQPTVSSFVLQSREGVTPHPQAIAVQRPQVISGWDFERRRPKPSRRCVPAGTVLFLKLDGNEQQRRDWCEQIWMHCISDDDELRRAGFGLAALGIWSGEFADLPKGDDDGA